MLLIQMILAYAAFILISALPTLAPIVAVVLLLTGCLLLARAGGAPAKTALGVLCLGAAGFLALIVFDVDDRIPGTQAFRDIKTSVAQQQRAQQAVIPGGEYDRLMHSIRGERTCRWQQEPGAWRRVCTNER